MASQSIMRCDCAAILKFASRDQGRFAICPSCSSLVELVDQRGDETGTRKIATEQVFENDQPASVVAKDLVRRAKK